MTRYLTALAAAFLLALAPITFVPAPATAISCIPFTDLCQGGVLRHYAPDDDYDPHIIVFCKFSDGFTDGVSDPDWSKDKAVAEGTSSASDCGDDTDVVYLRPGEELWCFRGEWYKAFDATGSHKIDDLWERSCTLRKD